MALADLILQTVGRQQNPVESFQRASSNALGQNLARAQIESQQADLQRKRGLASLMQQGATPQQLAQAGHFEEAKAYADVANAQSPFDKEFYSNVIKATDQDLRSFNKESQELIGNFDTLEKLKSAAEGGDRSARNAMTVTVGRMLSPGIFTEGEAAALQGGQTTIQALVSMLSQGSAAEQARANLMRQLDPYGENFNVQGIYDVGLGRLQASGAVLKDKYDLIKGRAEDSQMRSEHMRGLFGRSNPYYEKINQYIAAESGAQKSPQATPSTNTKGWKLMQDAQGNRAYVGPNGEIEEI